MHITASFRHHTPTHPTVIAMNSVARSVALSIAVVLQAVSFSTFAEAQTWTRFHGPNGSGYIADGKIPDSWTDSDYTWTTTLPAGGISSPVAWGDKVFMLSADDATAQRHVLAFDLRSGKLLWDKKFASKPHHLHSRNRFASSTPCCDANHVFVAWSQPEHTTVMCFTHEGDLVWEKDLGTWQSQHGFGTSPMLIDDLVIVFDSQQAEQLKPGETPGASEMVALNQKTGEIVWRTPLATTRVCYGTPCIYEADGSAKQLVDANTGNGMFGLDPKSGKMLWSLKVFRARCCSSPVVAGNLVIASAGSGGGGNHLVAVKPGDQPVETFRLEKSAPYVPTPVVAGELLFAMGDNGVASCCDASTGEVYWTRRAGGTISSSPIVVGNKLLTIDMDGKATVLSATKDYKKLGEAELGGDVQATPAFIDGYLLLRAGNRLMALGPKGV